jgi:5-methylcytosine-specific restriction endonuclease McrA
VKKRAKYNQNACIRGALRRQFSRSPIVREVLMKVRREVAKFNKDGSRSKKDAVQYCCSACGQWIGSTKCTVDHITPVIDVQAGFVDWNQFIDRLFCDASNLQVICDPCHNTKTQGERIARLIIQYTEELDGLELDVEIANTRRKLIGHNDVPKDLVKVLNKYIAKKKTMELKPIVERAKRLKDSLK